MRAGLVLWSALASAPLHAEPGLKEAATLYHRGRYDSALAVLDASRPGIAKRRDSLSLFQYSGMTSARLGRAEQAAADFRLLLALDSLFQFPRNEDASILEAFAKARTLHKEENHPAAKGAPAGDSTLPARAPSAGEESTALLAVRANPPAGESVPIPAYPESRFPGPEPGPHAPGGDFTRDPRRYGIGLAMGAVPLGGGWLAEGHYKQGLALAFFQIGGAALSLYASSRITAEEKDLYGIQNDRELGNVHKWQWTQGVALSTAVGAYLYSLIASRRP
jgi:hypothetical protein